jgi:hypothetical protein
MQLQICNDKNVLNKKAVKTQTKNSEVFSAIALGP